LLYSLSLLGFRFFLWSSGSCRSINHRQSLCPPSYNLAQLQRSLCSVGDGRPTVKRLNRWIMSNPHLFEYLSPESCRILQHYCDRNWKVIAIIWLCEKSK
jgi:hypothetical protein